MSIKLYNTIHQIITLGVVGVTSRNFTRGCGS